MQNAQCTMHNVGGMEEVRCGRRKEKEGRAVRCFVPFTRGGTGGLQAVRRSLRARRIIPLGARSKSTVFRARARQVRSSVGSPRSARLFFRRVERVRLSVSGDACFCAVPSEPGRRRALARTCCRCRTSSSGPSRRSRTANGTAACWLRAMNPPGILSPSRRRISGRRNGPSRRPKNYGADRRAQRRDTRNGGASACILRERVRTSAPARPWGVGQITA